MRVVFDNKRRIAKLQAYILAHSWKNATSRKFWTEELIFGSDLLLKARLS